MLPDDLVPFHRWFIENTPERQTCRPIVPRTYDERLAAFMEWQSDDTRASMAVIQNSDGALVGRVSYFDLNRRNQSVEIGYTIGTEYQGKGYGREAVRLLIAHLFDTLKINKVMAQTAAFNEPSVALLRSQGFTQDGVLRQHHELDGVLHDDLLFSILRTEFTE
jgi:ribosomal-protein-alanine N-acetyltransferase